MNSQVASSLFLLFSEFLALARDFMVHRRQEQAEALKPGADAIKSRIDELVRHAIELEASQVKPPLYPAPLEPEVSIHDHAQALKDHIDGLVTAAHSSTAAGSEASPVQPPRSESQAFGSGPGSETATAAETKSSSEAQ